MELNSNQSKFEFFDVAEEILMLPNKPGISSRVAIEIQAESQPGFDDGRQQAIRENCDQLNFKNRSFED